EIPPYPDKEEEGYEDWMDTPIQLALRKVGGTGFGDIPDNTQDEQSVKDTGIKETEDDGDVQLKMPEHGQE
ncbi:hypothetical protein RZS08_62475, partial [Arthrospira platensis SPKY1]|nr:hypothetical protein [Arthrospira platensis SPKY1]